MIMNHEKRAEYQSISAIKSKAASWAANAMPHRLEGPVNEQGTIGLVHQQLAGGQTTPLSSGQAGKILLRQIAEQEWDEELLRLAIREGRLYLALPEAEQPASEQAAVEKRQEMSPQGKKEEPSIEQAAVEERPEMSPQGKKEQPSIEQAAVEECQLSPEQVREKILDYVERISPYATCAKVRDIWQTILQDEELFPLFRFTRYAKSRGRINWYRVTVVMCQLYELGVYRQELSAEKLHCCLEGTKRRNARYTGMSRYLLEREQSKRIQQILRQFRP